MIRLCPPSPKTRTSLRYPTSHSSPQSLTIQPSLHFPLSRQQRWWVSHLLRTRARREHWFQAKLRGEIGDAAYAWPQRLPSDRHSSREKCVSIYWRHWCDASPRHSRNHSSMTTTSRCARIVDATFRGHRGNPRFDEGFHETRVLVLHVISLRVNRVWVVHAIALELNDDACVLGVAR